mmetsp:Transcript_25940/g.72642  ORF Transcript_25940/g.72642 Transcript_25940/m.72642 type:complete len:317 (+) Transcript_25940:465-1415(+)
MHEHLLLSCVRQERSQVVHVSQVVLPSLSMNHLIGPLYFLLHGTQLALHCQEVAPPWAKGIVTPREAQSGLQVCQWHGKFWGPVPRQGDLPRHGAAGSMQRSPATLLLLPHHQPVNPEARVRGSKPLLDRCKGLPVLEHLCPAGPPGSKQGRVPFARPLHTPAQRVTAPLRAGGSLDGVWPQHLCGRRVRGRLLCTLGTGRSRHGSPWSLRAVRLWRPPFPWSSKAMSPSKPWSLRAMGPQPLLMPRSLRAPGAQPLIPSRAMPVVLSPRAWLSATTAACRWQQSRPHAVALAFAGRRAAGSSDPTPPRSQPLPVI